MLKRLTASLSVQGLEPGLIADLTGSGPGEDAGRAARLWRRTGPEADFTADEPPVPDAGLVRPDGALDARSLFETLVPSLAAGEPRVLAIPQALANPATLAGLAHAGVDAFAVAVTGRSGAGDWAPIVRDAFDAGYVSLADKELADKAAAPRLIAFLRSDLVQAADRLGGLNRGVVSMTTLGQNGRFANQLMQYAYVKLYALRHGLRPVLPHWVGADLYRCRDAKPDGDGRAELRFFAFDNDDLHLWRVPDPPIDIDLWGYFQELPACWKPHRQFLRHLYALPPAFAGPLERCLSEATDKGRRDLVAVHVRRGDYRTLHRQGLPWYRPVPDEWYAAWLRRILPGLRDPLVYVATDEPEAVFPAFAEFAPVGTGAFEVPGLAADVLDFELLRRAGHLAIANSSFSRMAAILASDTQACVCPDFEKETFVAYEPWIDEAFWSRFEAEPKAEAIMGYGPDAQGARALAMRGEIGRWRREAETLRASVATLTTYLGEREKALRDYDMVNRELARINQEQSQHHKAEVERWQARIGELERFLAQREQALRDYEAANRELGRAIDEQSGRNAEEIERWRAQVAELGRFLAQREEALRGYEAVNRELGRTINEQSGRNAEEIGRWQAHVGELERFLIQREETLREFEAANRKLGKALNEQSRWYPEELERRSRQIGDLERALRKSQAEASELARRIAGREHLETELEVKLRRVDEELGRLRSETIEARRHLDVMARDYEVERQLARETAERLEEERQLQVAELESEIERQRQLARREQARVSALAAVLDERTREGVALKAELDRIQLQLRLPSVSDYLRLLAFWPAGWLLRLAAGAFRARAPFLAKKLDGLAGLIERRHYRSFVGQFGRSVLRLPGRIGERLARAFAAPPFRPVVPAQGSTAGSRSVAARPVPDLPIPAETYVEVAPRPHDGPVVLVLGSADPEAMAATLKSLASQTLRSGDVRVSPGEDGLACRPGELICIVAAGARLDPTAIELLAAALLSVPGCKFAAAFGDVEQAGGSEHIAVCLIPGRIWRAHACPALGVVRSESFPEALAAVMQGVAGQGLFLPLPLATWASGPESGFAASAWPAVRAAPDRSELWSASPLDGAARVETFLASKPARDDGNARPHLLVVVPWLPIGGSEIVLLEVLERIVERWAISIMTTLPSDHGMRAAFAGLTDEIYHAGDVFDPFRLQAFVSGLIMARGTRVVLSSNSGALYRAVPELKAAHPEVAFIDILHNDLPTGHIRSAVEAATSLDRHVAVSRRVGGALIARGVPRERVVVVPNGVDAEVFSPEAVDRWQARAALGLDGDALVLAFVGRFSEEKRAGAFAEIVSRVRKHVPVRAIAVGEGQEEADLRARIAAEGLPIEIVSKMPRSDLVGLYAAADLLVLTSNIEGMPMVVLEAMATGCPAAVTEVGDVRRVVEPGVSGFIAPVDAPETLADLIVAAALEPGRLAQMRAAARAAVVDKGMTKAAMLDGYDRLLAAVGGLERARFDPADAAL